MRVIGGKLGGRRFNPPISKWPTRPTTDIAREGLFNMLDHSIDLESMDVLDLFGGSGGISYEFCSRGCPSVVYVDKYVPCVRFVKETSALFKIEDQLEIIKSDVFKFLKSTERAFDLIFCDPPYALKQFGNIPDLIFEVGVLKEGGILIIEHDSSNNFDDHDRFWKSRNYGDSIFSFFRG